MKPTLFITLAAALFTLVPTAPAAPAAINGKTVRIHEIHQVRNAPCKERKPEATEAANDRLLFRSRAELEMVNPG